MTDEDIEEQVIEARRVREDFAQRTAEIQADGDLTPEARRSRVDHLRTDLGKRMAELRADLRSDRAKESEKAFRRALGSASPLDDGELMAHRDAVDRAEACADVTDAVRLIERAHRSSDPGLAKAAAARAWAEGWMHAVDRYAQLYPDSRPALETLASHRARAARLASAHGRMEESMQFSLPHTGR